MTSRRAGVAPGLLDRVRWGNVGRLAALLAGVILLVTGPHGCGPARGIGDRRLEIGDASPQPPALPSAVKAAPAVTAPSVIPSLPAVRKKKQVRKHRSRHRHRVRNHRHARPKPLQSPIPQSPISPPPAATPAPPPPPVGGAGEFAP